MSYNKDYNKVYNIIKQEVLDALRIITDYISDQIAEEVCVRLLEAKESTDKRKACDIEPGDFITIKSVHITNAPKTPINSENNMAIRKGMQLQHKSLRELQAKFDAYPEQAKKELCDMLFKHTEEIIKSCSDNLKYTEPLRIIGYGSFKSE